MSSGLIINAISSWLQFSNWRGRTIILKTWNEFRILFRHFYDLVYSCVDSITWTAMSLILSPLIIDAFNMENTRIYALVFRMNGWFFVGTVRQHITSSLEKSNLLICCFVDCTDLSIQRTCRSTNSVSLFWISGY